MKGTKVLIVEDDAFISEDIASRLSEDGYKIAGQAYDYDEAIDLIKTAQPDVAILDIELNGEKNGIDVAHFIAQQNSFPFLFLTSFSDSSTLTKISQTGALGYLLKPFDEKSLMANIELAIHKFNSQTRSKALNKDGEVIFVKIKSALVKMPLQDILYAEAYDNYCYIKTKEHKHLISQTLKSVEQKLIQHGFMRVHRGYLINLAKIDSIIDQDVMLGGELIPIGRSFKEELLSLLQTL